jgi:SNF2 family DNA or RNA helicase
LCSIDRNSNSKRFKRTLEFIEYHRSNTLSVNYHKLITRNYLKFSSENSVLKISEIQSKLKKYMLRRVKENVEKEIPKEETIVEVELTNIQKKLYKAIFEKNHEILNQYSKNKKKISLLNIYMQIRKICNHPFLLNGVEDNLIEEEKPTKFVPISNSLASMNS